MFKFFHGHCIHFDFMFGHCGQSNKRVGILVEQQEKIINDYSSISFVFHRHVHFGCLSIRDTL